MKQHDELAIVRDRLNAWAMWLHSVGECRLGYPAKCPFTVSAGGVQEYENDQAEIIEAIMVHLRRELPMAFKVLKQSYYFGCSQRDGAERLDLTRVRYCDLKLQGETFVLTYMLMADKFKKIA